MVCSIYFPVAIVAIAFCPNGRHGDSKLGAKQTQMVMTSPTPRVPANAVDLGGATFLAPGSDLGCDGALDLPLEQDLVAPDLLLKRVCSRQDKKVAPKLLQICYHEGSLATFRSAFGSSQPAWVVCPVLLVPGTWGWNVCTSGKKRCCTTEGRQAAML